MASLREERLQCEALGIENVMPVDRQKINSVCMRIMRGLNPDGPQADCNISIAFQDVVAVGTNGPTHYRIRTFDGSMRVDSHLLGFIKCADGGEPLKRDPMIADASIFPAVDKTEFMNREDTMRIFAKLPQFVPMLVVEVWSHAEYQRLSIVSTEEDEVKADAPPVHVRRGKVITIPRGFSCPGARHPWQILPEVTTWEIDTGVCAGMESSAIPASASAVERLAISAAHKTLYAIHSDQRDFPAEQQFRVLGSGGSSGYSHWCVVAYGLKNRISLQDLCAIYATDTSTIVGVYYDFSAVTVQMEEGYTVGGLVLEAIIDTNKPAQEIVLCAKILSPADTRTTDKKRRNSDHGRQSAPVVVVTPVPATPQAPSASEGSSSVVIKSNPHPLPGPKRMRAAAQNEETSPSFLRRIIGVFTSSSS